MADTFFEHRKTPILADWLNDVNDVVYGLSSTASGKGAELVTNQNGGTVQDHIDSVESALFVFDSPNNGTDVTAAIQAADAARAGKELVFSPGTYLITANTTFTAHIKMQPGARLVVTNPAVFLRFSAGFSAPLSYCLDTDGPTQFVGVNAIYPQWFGSCGLSAVDSSLPLQRAYRATRAGMNGISATTDAAFGCVRVHLIRGEYRCNDVDVYCQSITTGEVTGAINGSYITQIDRTKPALRVHAKNYSLTGGVLNDSNGINTFHRVTFRGGPISDSNENEFMVRFYSPAESAALLGIAGDGAGGNVGHIDSMFERCWFQFSPGFSVGARDGRLIFWLKSCTFDVVRGGVHYAGTSYGRAHFQDVQGYTLVRGFARVDTSSANETSIYVNGGEVLGAGNCQNSEATYRRAIHYVPTGSTSGEVVLNDLRLSRRDVSGNRYGGPILIRNAKRFAADNLQTLDPDSADFFKAVSVGADEVYISDARIKSDTLASYPSSRMLGLAQAPTVTQLDNVVIQNTNASEINEAVQADAGIVNGKFDVRFVGSFTTLYTANISSQAQRNSITRWTVERPGTAAPTLGTWSVGDRIINSAPAVGQPKAWVCTVAGTPGTWVSEGNL